MDVKKLAEDMVYKYDLVNDEAFEVRAYTEQPDSNVRYYETWYNDDDVARVVEDIQERLERAIALGLTDKDELDEFVLDNHTAESWTKLINN